MDGPGWMPERFGVRHIPTSRFGYPQGTHGQAEIDVIVDHIAAGWKSTIDRMDEYRNINFALGRDGSKSQYVSIFDAHWGHGITGSIAGFDRGNPHLAAWERRPGAQWIDVPTPYGLRRALIEPLASNPWYRQNVPNSHGPAKEHEGFPGDVWTPQMRQASRDVDEWIAEENYRVRGKALELGPLTKIGHNQIEGGVDRKNCPGPNAVKWEGPVWTPGEDDELNDAQIAALGRIDAAAEKLERWAKGMTAFGEAQYGVNPDGTKAENAVWLVQLTGLRKLTRAHIPNEATARALGLPSLDEARPVPIADLQKIPIVSAIQPVI